MIKFVCKKLIYVENVKLKQIRIYNRNKFEKHY